jgi:hypothetical protein
MLPRLKEDEFTCARDCARLAHREISIQAHPSIFSIWAETLESSSNSKRTAF